uniref:H(+)-transporting two-sector ATPase n=1 Tax=Pyramimonas parkeae TaxID=36894 RepID=A0A1D8I1U8_9CHLO|nr:ATP synthase F0 subunit 8 [Pyramimonas parkeae]AOT98948.1 ATP synthase F0 subunit 8 [Pyramimonas parkeae]
MPQLDQFCFFNQYFWLVLHFFVFYILIFKTFLPKISQILKVREIKMEIQSDNRLFEVEKATLDLQAKNTFFICSKIKELESLHINLLRKTSLWTTESIKDFDQQVFKQIHHAYIQGIGKLSLSQNLTLNLLGIILPPVNKFTKSHFQKRDKVFTKSLLKLLKV